MVEESSYIKATVACKYEVIYKVLFCSLKRLKNYKYLKWSKNLLFMLHLLKSNFSYFQTKINTLEFLTKKNRKSQHSPNKKQQENLRTLCKFKGVCRNIMSNPKGILRYLIV